MQGAESTRAGRGCTIHRLTYIKGRQQRVEARCMSGESLADCKRCGREVREDHSHVMVVPVGHKRIYFHAGCEPAIRDNPDLAEDKIRSADKTSDSTETAVLGGR